MVSSWSAIPVRIGWDAGMTRFGVDRGESFFFGCPNTRTVFNKTGGHATKDALPSLELPNWTSEQDAYTLLLATPPTWASQTREACPEAPHWKGYFPRSLPRVNMWPDARFLPPANAHDIAFEIFCFWIVTQLEQMGGDSGRGRQHPSQAYIRSYNHFTILLKC